MWVKMRDLVAASSAEDDMVKGWFVLPEILPTVAGRRGGRKWLELGLGIEDFLRLVSA
jgi:hypothetical protein